MKKLLMIILPFVCTLAQGQVSRISFSSGGGSSAKVSSSFGETFIGNNTNFSLGSRKGDTTYTISSSITPVEKPTDRIALFPNPTQNEITVFVKGTNENNFAIKAYDISGNELLSSAKNSQQTKVCLSGYASGTYILSVLTPDGKLLFNQKIVKQ